MTDREKLIILAHDYFKAVPWYADIADLNPEELIDHLLANGVTIPVRCKDCISGKGSTHKVCPLYKQGLMKDDDYCSVGERRSDVN